MMMMIVNMYNARDSFDEIGWIISSEKKIERENLIRISIYTDAKFHEVEM